MNNSSEYLNLSPSASSLVESMRSIGYNLETAVADLIDNSLTAGATEIQININWQNGQPCLTLRDNGSGMSKAELINAMRAGSRSPLEPRSTADLGRFGLGLKTASFSQCRSLTVATIKDEQLTAATWDLDLVSSRDSWDLLVRDNISDIGIDDFVTSCGTVIIWQKLDRLLQNDDEEARRRDINKATNDLGDHLSLVFHRYLTGEKGIKRIKIFVNGLAIKPFEPFNTSNLASTIEPEEIIEYDGKTVRIEAITLPHHSKTTPIEWQQYSGKEGYLENQGFYVYRQKRLITHGTWFGIIRKTESTKLTRIKIDIDNDADNDWSLDIKKARCMPPPIVKKRLKKITERLIQSSRRVFSGRGRRLLENDTFPVWIREKADGIIDYKLNLDHPSILNLISTCSPKQANLLGSLLNAIPASLPIDRIYSDYSQNPEEYGKQKASEEDIKELILSAAAQLTADGLLTNEQIITMLSQSALFAENRGMIEEIVLLKTRI